MSDPTVLIVCQARIGSTRLPRKVLLPLAEEPLLVRFIERVRRSKYAQNIVVATTNDPSDDILESICKKNDMSVFRGHATDLLDRHYRCSINYNADIIVKIPSDCPLIDPLIIDKVIGTFLDNADNVDYVSNLHPSTYPDGNDVEVMSRSALHMAWDNATKSHEREHTTPWLWDGNESIRCMNVVWESGRDLSMSQRWTIDYPEDYMLIKAIYDELYDVNPVFSLIDILNFLDQRPEIAALNSHLLGMNWYLNHMNELQTITSPQSRSTPPLTT